MIWLLLLTPPLIAVYVSGLLKATSWLGDRFGFGACLVASMCGVFWPLIVGCILLRVHPLP